jgi:hypothetical protein
VLRVRYPLDELYFKNLCVSFPLLERMLLQSGTISALRSYLGWPVLSWPNSPPHFIDTLPNLIDLFLLEGCSTGSITISYLTCIVFGAWLGFASEAM